MTDQKTEFHVPVLRRAFSLRARPLLKHHTVISQSWNGPELSIAVFTDLHVVSPWVSLDDISRIASQITNLKPDLIILAGDFLASHIMPGRRASASQVIDALGELRAPLGVLGVLGNHDWRDCPVAKASNFRENSVVDAISASHIHLLQNSCLPLEHHGKEFWMVGLDSQRPVHKDRSVAFHQPDLAYRGIPDGANSVLVAHEPDYFADGDTRSALQISGHTHGGQMNLFGWRPMTPSIYGGRYAYGHYHEQGRDLVVSGGIGFSGLPLRIAQPPEVTLITLRGAT